MEHFVLQLVVFVALCSFSKGSEHTCSGYFDDDGYHTGLSCPSKSDASFLNYCCQPTLGGTVPYQFCCTKSDWQGYNSSPDIDNGTYHSSHYTYWGVGVSAVIFIAISVAVAFRVARTQRRAAVIVTSTRVAPPMSVVTVSTGNQATRVGPYQQFENPPSYTPN